MGLDVVPKKCARVFDHHRITIQILNFKFQHCFGNHCPVHDSALHRLQCQPERTSALTLTGGNAIASVLSYENVAFHEVVVHR